MQPVGRHGAGEIEVENTGLDPGKPIDGIDREHSIHLRGHDQDGVIERSRTTGQAGAGAAGHEGSAMPHGHPNAGLHLGRTRGEAHHAGVPFEVGCIAPVEGQLGRTDPNAIGRQRLAQIIDQ